MPTNTAPASLPDATHDLLRVAELALAELEWMGRAAARPLIDGLRRAIAAAHTTTNEE